MVGWSGMGASESRGAKECATGEALISHVGFE